MHRHVRRLTITLSLFIAFVLSVDTLFAAQVVSIRPPLRRQRIQGTTVPRGAQGFTASQGLGPCDRSFWNDDLYAYIGVFVPNSYVLGLAPTDGMPVDISEEVVSFWLMPDSNGVIELTYSDLGAVSRAGGALWDAVLIGETEYSLSGGEMIAVGRCSNMFNDADGGGFLYDVWDSYYNNSRTSPNSTSGESSTRAQPDELVPEQSEEGSTAFGDNGASGGGGVSSGFVDRGGLDDGYTSGSLTSAEGDGYWLNIPPGNALQLNVISIRDTVIDILDSNGDWIDGDDDSGGNRNPSICFEIPYEGVFYVVVRAYDGASYGTYQLQVSYC